MTWHPQSQPGIDALRYVEAAIASFAKDPPDTQFQKGFLAALEIVRDEAFGAAPVCSSTDTPQPVCKFCARRVFEPCQSIAQAQTACTLMSTPRYPEGDPRNDTL